MTRPIHHSHLKHTGPKSDDVEVPCGMATVKSSRSSAVSVIDSSRRNKTRDDVENKSSSRSTGRGGGVGGDTLPKIGKEPEEKPVAEYDDFTMRPVMFGDPFGSRGDYSKGIFYGGRKKYLLDSSAEKDLNLLEPPPDCMTMRQRRNKAKLSKTQVQLRSKRLDFKRKDDTDEAVMQARAVAKKNLQQSKKNVLVIKHQVTSKYDWTVQRQAGCTFWLHKPTGTISNEMPYCQDEEDDSVCTTSDQDSQGGVSTSSSPQKQQSRNKPSQSARFVDHGEREEGEDETNFDSDLPPATGSLVYDSYEFNNFLNILNEMQSQEESLKAAKEAKMAAKKGGKNR